MQNHFLVLKSLSTIFTLLSKAHQLFKSSEIEEKRRIITIMFPNLFLDKEKLIITPRKPFDLFLNSGACPEWLSELDAVLTSNYSNVVKFNRKTEEVMGMAA